MTKLSKLSALSLTAALALGAIAGPALADNSKVFDDAAYIQQLRYDGVNAIAADVVTGSVIRATVIAPDGHTTYRFFDKDTLQPVAQ